MTACAAESPSKYAEATDWCARIALSTERASSDAMIVSKAASLPSRSTTSCSGDPASAQVKSTAATRSGLASRSHPLKGDSRAHALSTCGWMKSRTATRTSAAPGTSMWVWLVEIVCRRASAGRSYPNAPGPMIMSARAACTRRAASEARASNMPAAARAYASADGGARTGVSGGTPANAAATRTRDAHAAIITRLPSQAARSPETAPARPTRRGCSLVGCSRQG